MAVGSRYHLSSIAVSRRICRGARAGVNLFKSNLEAAKSGKDKATGTAETSHRMQEKTFRGTKQNLAATLNHGTVVLPFP